MSDSNERTFLTLREWLRTGGICDTTVSTMIIATHPDGTRDKHILDCHWEFNPEDINAQLYLDLKVMQWIFMGNRSMLGNTFVLYLASSYEDYTLWAENYKEDSMEDSENGK